MKEKRKLLICIAAVLFVMIGFSPMKARADYKVVYQNTISTLKQNKWKLLKHREHDDKRDYETGDTVAYRYYHFYKITVPADGYIKIQTDKRTAPGGFAICSSAKKNKGYDSDITDAGYIFYWPGKIYYVPVKKGTYYLVNPNDWYNEEEVRVYLKWSFEKAQNPTNYCRAKAKNIPRGKNQVIVYYYGYEYTRWYKIKLTRNKTITLKQLPNDEDGDTLHFTLYNSSGIMVDESSLTETDLSFKTAKLPKGTYYIAVDRTNDKFFGRKNGMDTGRAFGFSWK